MEILQNANNKDLFIPELDDERKLKTADPVASDLLGALLSVSCFKTTCYKYIYGRKGSTALPGIHAKCVRPSVYILIYFLAL